MAKSLQQLIADEKPEIVAEAREQADSILLEISLSELREKVKMTQVEMAASLGVTQPSVAELEKVDRDLKLSTLKRYVEATGSKLRLDVELPDGTHYGFHV